MELYLKLIDVLFPVFFIIGIGYYIGKKDPKFNTKFITNFAGTIGTPAMIFYTITTTGVTLEIFIEYFIYAAIIIIGILCVIYTVMGGIEAVVWTDAIQAVVLLGGAILCFILVVVRLDGGFDELFSIAHADS